MQSRTTNKRRFGHDAAVAAAVGAGAVTWYGDHVIWLLRVFVVVVAVVVVAAV